MDSEEKASRDFYELCYDQYKVELDEAEKLYQKVAIVFIILPILVGATVKIGRIDLLKPEHFFTQIDIFLYYFWCATSWVLIGISVAFALLCVIPCSYKRIGDMEGWHDWRKRYQKYIEESEAKETVDNAMIRDICSKLADAQTRNAPINEKRRKYFRKSILLAGISTIFIALQGLFYLILKLEGV